VRQEEIYEDILEGAKEKIATLMESEIVIGIPFIGTPELIGSSTKRNRDCSSAFPQYLHDTIAVFLALFIDRYHLDLGKRRCP